MSEILTELIREYVRQHEPGNPQRRLDRLTGQMVEPLPRYLTCRHSRKALHRGEFYCDCEAYWKIPQACVRCHRYRPEP